MAMTKFGAGVAMILLVAGAAGWSAAQDNAAQDIATQDAATPEEKPASYSARQATNGKRAYKRYCGMCHGENLNDGEFGGPPLNGLRFQQSFGDAPVSALYFYLGAQMPPDRPGRLSPKARIEVIAYLLKRNGYRAGAALPEDELALDELVIRK